MNWTMGEAVWLGSILAGSALTLAGGARDLRRRAALFPRLFWVGVYIGAYGAVVACSIILVVMIVVKTVKGAA